MNKIIFYTIFSTLLIFVSCDNTFKKDIGDRDIGNCKIHMWSEGKSGFFNENSAYRMEKIIGQHRGFFSDKTPYDYSIRNTYITNDTLTMSMVVNSKSCMNPGELFHINIKLVINSINNVIEGTIDIIDSVFSASDEITLPLNTVSGIKSRTFPVGNNSRYSFSLRFSHLNNNNKICINSELTFYDLKLTETGKFICYNNNNFLDFDSS